MTDWKMIADAIAANCAVIDDARERGFATSPPYSVLGQLVQQHADDILAALRAASPPNARLEVEAMREGYDAAVNAVRAWSAGFLNDASRARLAAAASDLERNRSEILATIRTIPLPDNVGDMAAFGASDAASYLYPGADQQAERAAFCEGARRAIPLPAAPALDGEEMPDYAEPYAAAGHDWVSLFAPGWTCKDCGSAQIDLSEDLAYGDMRKCEKATPPAPDAGLVEALARSVMISAYRKDDPLTIRLSFTTDEDRVAAGNALNEALAKHRALPAGSGGAPCE